MPFLDSHLEIRTVRHLPFGGRLVSVENEDGRAVTHLESTLRARDRHIETGGGAGAEENYIYRHVWAVGGRLGKR